MRYMTLDDFQEIKNEQCYRPFSIAFLWPYLSSSIDLGRGAPGRRQGPTHDVAPAQVFSLRHLLSSATVPLYPLFLLPFA